MKCFAGWKDIQEPRGMYTGHTDKSGDMICIGDVISYPKRIRAESSWSWASNSREVKPGYTKPTQVKVVGFGHLVKKHWNGKIREIRFINVAPMTGKFTDFRLYRTDKVFIVK